MFGFVHLYSGQVRTCVEPICHYLLYLPHKAPKGNSTPGLTAYWLNIAHEKRSEHPRTDMLAMQQFLADFLLPTHAGSCVNRRHQVADRGGLRLLHLSGPRACVEQGCAPQGDHGRALRQEDGHLQGAGRVHAHVFQEARPGMPTLPSLCSFSHQRR